VPVPQPGHGWLRLVAYGLVGWALCGLAMGLLMRLVPQGVALALHAIAAPLIFAAIARQYFSARGAREALTAAWAFTGLVAGLDLIVVAGLVQRSLAMFASVVGTWLPFALIFGVTWAMGVIVNMTPLSPRRPHGSAG
jgi:hypothetical protein